MKESYVELCYCCSYKIVHPFRSFVYAFGWFLRQSWQTYYGVVSEESVGQAKQNNDSKGVNGRGGDPEGILYFPSCIGEQFRKWEGRRLSLTFLEMGPISWKRRSAASYDPGP